MFVLMIILVLAGDLLFQAFSAKNSFLTYLIWDNCGAVPLFLNEVLSVEPGGNPKLLDGFVKCGFGAIGFLVAPGVLTVAVYIFKFLK